MSEFTEPTNILKYFFDLIDKYDLEPVWESLESFLQETTRYEAAESIQITSNLLRQTHFVEKLIGHTSMDERIDDMESIAKKEFRTLISIVHQKLLVKEQQWPVLINIYDLLLKMYLAVPEIEENEGEFLPVFEKMLPMMLDPRLGWNLLCFEVKVFRSVYIRLADRLGLNEASGNRDRPQLLFGCLVASVLIAIVKWHSMAIGQFFEKLEEVSNFAELLEKVIPSAHFRNLSVFLLMGFVILVKHRLLGKFVTDSPSRELPYNENEKTDFMFGLNVKSRSIFAKPFDYSDFPAMSPIEFAKRSFEVHVVEVLFQGFLSTFGRGVCIENPVCGGIRQLDLSLIESNSNRSENLVEMEEEEEEQNFENPGEILTFESVGLRKPPFYLYMEMEDYLKMKTSRTIAEMEQELTRRHEEIKEEAKRVFQSEPVLLNKKQKRVWEWAKQVRHMEKEHRPPCYADPNYVPPNASDTPSTSNS